MKHYYSLLIIFVFLGYSCVESPDIPLKIVNGRAPSVTTGEPDDILFYEATLFGTVDSNNGNVTSSRGFYIGTGANPLEDGEIIDCGSGTGPFSYNVKGLKNGTKYYYLSYARNLDGTNYGKVISFETGGRVWEEMAIFPGQGRLDASTFAIGNKLYITCGSTIQPQSLGDAWEYDVTTNLWSPLPDFPSEKRRDATAFTVGENAYVGMGQSIGSNFFNDFYPFSNGSWNTTSVGDNAISPRRRALGFGLKGKGYFVGGSNPNNLTLRDVWEFNPVNNQWKNKKDFPVGLINGISIYGENRAFVGFGTTDTNPEKKIWEYNEVLDTWEEFAKTPDNIPTVYTGAILKGKMYVSDDNNRIWELNLTTKEWKAKSKMPEIFDEYKGFQYMYSANDHIYIGLNYFCRYFYKYNPITDN